MDGNDRAGKCPRQGEKAPFRKEKPAEAAPAVARRQQHPDFRSTAVEVQPNQESNQEQGGDDQEKAKPQEEAAEIRASGRCI